MMRKKILKKLALVSCSVMAFCALIGGGLLRSPMQARADSNISAVVDTSISNTVWEVTSEKAGSWTKTTEYGGEEKASVLFTSTTTAGAGVRGAYSTLTTLEEYKNFDLYLDLTYYKGWRNSSCSGFKIDFGDGMSLELPSPLGQTYSVSAWKHPLTKTGETKVRFSSGDYTEYIWVNNGIDGTTTNRYKLSVRDDGICLYDRYNSTTGEWAVLYEKAGWENFNFYHFDLSDNADYTSEYAPVSISVDGYTTKGWSASRMEIVPYGETEDREVPQTAYESYTLFETQTLNVTLPTDISGIKGVTYGSQFIPADQYYINGSLLRIENEIINNEYLNTNETANTVSVYTAKKVYTYDVTVIKPSSITVTYKSIDDGATLKVDEVPFDTDITPYQWNNANFYAWFDKNGKKVDFSALKALEDVTFYGYTNDSMQAVTFEYKNNLARDEECTINVKIGTKLSDAVESFYDYIVENDGYIRDYGVIGHTFDKWTMNGEEVLDTFEIVESCTLTAQYNRLVNTQNLYEDFTDNEKLDSMDWDKSWLSKETVVNNELQWSEAGGYFDSFVTAAEYEDFELSFDINSFQKVAFGEYLFNIEFALDKDGVSQSVGNKGGLELRIYTHSYSGDIAALVSSYNQKNGTNYTLEDLNDKTKTEVESILGYSHDGMTSLMGYVLYKGNVVKSISCANFFDFNDGSVQLKFGEVSYPLGNGSYANKVFEYYSINNVVYTMHIKVENGTVQMGYAKNGGEIVWSAACDFTGVASEYMGQISVGRNDSRLKGSTLILDNIALINTKRTESEVSMNVGGQTAEYDYVIGSEMGNLEIGCELRGQGLVGVKYAVDVGDGFSAFRTADWVVEDPIDIYQSFHLSLAKISSVLEENSQAMQGDSLKIKLRMITDTDYADIILNISSAPFTMKVFNGAEEFKAIENVQIGATIQLPQAPEKVGYDFIGYKDRITGEIITESSIKALYKTEYELVYQIKRFVVRFYDAEGALLRTVRDVEYGSAVADTLLKENGKAYTWEQAFDCVTSDLEIHEKSSGFSCNSTISMSLLPAIGVALISVVMLFVRKKERE